ncbi:MAG: peptide deformylase [Nitrospirae bacterium]|nr:peptide deformylase [Nitrospirota bacterium]
MVLEIKKYPDPVLTKKAERIEKIDQEIQKLIDDMIETMYAAPGVGLAAPQVGHSIKLTVFDSSVKEEEGRLTVLINPEIIEKSGEIIMKEGCLSVPGFEAEIKRPEQIKVNGLDRNGQPITIEATGFLARVIQHELDHLDGILLLDRISILKRNIYKRRFIKKQREESKEEAAQE